MPRTGIRQEAWLGAGMLIPSTGLTHRRPGTIDHVVEPDPQWIRPAEYFGSPLRR